MDKLEKIGFTAALSILFSWCGAVFVPFLLLVALQVFDYITGLLAAKYRQEKISSYKGFKGIAKKICMWPLVAVGGIMDWLVTYAVNSIGLSMDVSFVVAIVVRVWLMCNEIISLLENMIDIGVKFPAFMLRFAKNVQSKVEEKGGNIIESENSHEDN